MRDHHAVIRLYAVLLLLYPREFRDRFGIEMIDSFSEEIRCQRQVHGYRGVARTWCSAFCETFSVAGPLHLQGSIVPALLASILASSVLILAFFAAVTPHCMK